MEENKIVPAYMKNKDKNIENNKVEDKKNKAKKNKQKTKKIVFIVLAILILSLLIYGIVYLVKVIKYSKYNEYSKQIEKYGLGIMYDNEKTTSHESASRAEALKIIISSINNMINVDLTEHEEKYKNEDFVKYAIENNIVSSENLNEKNANSGITYIEFLTYYMNALVNLKNIQLDTSIYPSFTDISFINGEQLYAVSDLVSKGVLENNKVKLNPNRRLYKGELNKLACDIIKTYNLIVPEGEKFNINPEKEPSNASIYPYILYNVDKEVYEKELIVKNKEKFKEPYLVFLTIRTGLEGTISNINGYYNTILNIDYENIDKNQISSNLNKYCLFSADSEDLETYIDYAIKNQIKIKGSAKTQAPIIYFDGIYYRMRVKVEFEILNSNTTKNVIFSDVLDDENSFEYKNKKYSFYIDAILGKKSSNSSTLYVWDKSLYRTKIDTTLEGISLIEKENIINNDIDEENDIEDDGRVDEDDIGELED